MNLSQHHSRYLNAVVAVLAKLDNCRLECDGLTRVASALLNKAGIEHGIYGGHPCCIESNTEGPYHLWIELSDNWKIDFRLRNWIGPKKSAPHGLYNMHDFERMFYFANKERLPHTTMGTGMLSLLTDGVYGHLEEEIAELNGMYA